MKYIKKFESNDDKPDVNSVSNEFWEMVRIANWNLYIKIRNSQTYYNAIIKEANDECKNRIYSRYTFEQIKKFRKEYDIIYNQIYYYFEELWLGDPGLPVSDDSYTDLISSIVGKGKTFVKKVISNNKYIIDMANNDDYAENFGYILIPEREEYNEIRYKYNPMLRDIDKYNL